MIKTITRIQKLLLKYTKHIEDLKEQEKNLRHKWESEKALKDKINNKKAELEKARFELANAENNYDLEKSAIIRHGTIPKL